MIATTARRVAEIIFEQKLEWDSSAPEYGATHTLMASPFLVQPKGIRLDNDGVHEYWIGIDATWTLTHDGVGWRATTDAPGWEASREHVMRLADASKPKGAAFVGALPTETSEFGLTQGVTYQLRLGADAGRTKTILVLSAL